MEEVLQHIRADEEKELGSGEARAEGAAGEIGVACAALFQLIVARLGIVQLRKGDFAHFEALFARRHRPELLVRRAEGRDDKHLVERERFLRGADEADMFGMDGVERTPEERDFHTPIIQYFFGLRKFKLCVFRQKSLP